MFKKLILSILSALVLFQASASYALAGQPQPATWYNQPLQEWYLKVYDESVSPPEEIFGERYTAAQVDWIIWSIVTWLPTKILNPDGTACLIGIFSQLFTGQGLDFQSCKDRLFGYVPGNDAKLAMLHYDVEPNLFKAVFASDRELSGISYVKKLAQKVTTTPTANAQGFGYTTALSPFRAMWQVSRDISYSLFVFAAIILAFMVMFRVKLSPQTAVTVQSAVPKLIIGLILVTFSYAIAGFMVDLMYVIIGLVSIVGARFIGPDMNPAFVYKFLTTGGPCVNINIVGLGAVSFCPGIVGLFLLYLVLFFIAFVIVGLLTFGAAGFVFATVLAAAGIAILAASQLWIIALILFFVVLVIIAIALLIMIFKTMAAILKAFANVILLTIFAPFQLMAGTFMPSMGFGSWVKSFASNLGVFVGVGFMFMLATIFLFQAVASALTMFQFNAQNVFQNLINIAFGAAGGAFVQGSMQAGWPPLLASGGSASVAFFYLAFSFVIFFQIPKTADMIKSFIAGRPWAYGTAIGEGLAAGGLIGAAYSKSGMQNAVGTYTKGGQQNMWGGLVNRAADWAEGGRPGSFRAKQSQRLRETADSIIHPPKA